jgi:hypothetical protein
MGGCYWCLLVPDIEVLDTLTKGRATHQHTPAVYSVCETESIETEWGTW